jgi:hypothetical protein
MKKIHSFLLFFFWFILCVQNSVKDSPTMNEIRGIYQASIHPGQINIWYEPLERHGRSKPMPVDCDDLPGIPSRKPAQFTDNRHKGKLSPQALRKITKAVDYLVYLVPRRKYFTTADGRAGNYFLSFVTLTLSSDQIHTDYEIKQHCLEPFLNEMRQRWKVSNYIWRAEKQANGNLHFHIVADRFIWWSDLRDSWNYYQERLGYVTRYRNNQKAWHRDGFRFRPELAKSWSKDKQLAAYKTGLRHDWNSPNSSDVHSLKTITSVRSYICKYITKSEQSQEIAGRLWGCSYELTNLTGARCYAEGSLAPDLDKLLSPGNCKVYKGEYYTVIYITREILRKFLCFEIISELDDYIKKRFPSYHPPELWPVNQAA